MELQERVQPQEEVVLQNHMSMERGMVTDYLVEDSNIGFVGLGSVRLSVFAPPLKEYTSRGTSKRPRMVTVRTEPLEDNKRGCGHAKRQCRREINHRGSRNPQCQKSIVGFDKSFRAFVDTASRETTSSCSRNDRDHWSSEAHTNRY